MTPTTTAGPTPTPDRVICPRCRASGHEFVVVIQDNYGVCPNCEITWLRGDLNQMIAVPAR